MVALTGLTRIVVVVVVFLLLGAGAPGGKRQASRARAVGRVGAAPRLYGLIWLARGRLRAGESEGRGAARPLRRVQRLGKRFELFEEMCIRVPPLRHSPASSSSSTRVSTASSSTRACRASSCSCSCCSSSSSWASRGSSSSGEGYGKNFVEITG